MKRIFLALILSVNWNAHAAPDDIEAQKKNAFLVLNAFECYLVAPNSSESKHFLRLGLDAAHEFIEFVHTNNQVYLESVKPHVPLIWDIKPAAPDSEFIIGQICSHSINKVNSNTYAETQSWKMKRAKIYQEKNCQLLAR